MISWPQDFATNFQFLLRWIHFLGGITWIGMLYFFNLVNVQFQKEIDGAVKGKVNPILLPKTLWWFRWGAMVTWFSGFIYYAMLVNVEPTGHMPLAYFLVGWSIAFVVLSALYRTAVAGGPLKDGRVLSIVIARHRHFHRLRHGPHGPQRGLLEPHDLDHDRRRARHDHVPQRLDDHLAAAEAHHRGDEGHGRERRSRPPPTCPSGRGGRFSRPARTPGSPFRCSSSWEPRATSRSFRRSTRSPLPSPEAPPPRDRERAASGRPFHFPREPKSVPKMSPVFQAGRAGSRAIERPIRK